MKTYADALKLIEQQNSGIFDDGDRFWNLDENMCGSGSSESELRFSGLQILTTGALDQRMLNQGQGNTLLLSLPFLHLEESAPRFCCSGSM